MAEKWLQNLKELAFKNSVVVLCFDREDWDNLLGSNKGAREFTIARSHFTIKGVKKPAPCLLIGSGRQGEEIYFGLISSRQGVTTLETRIKIKNAHSVVPGSTAKLIALAFQGAHYADFRRRLSEFHPVIVLSPKLSVTVIEKLASIKSNKQTLRVVADALVAPKRYSGPAALQEDALQSALKAFGLSIDDQALYAEVEDRSETALSRVNVLEDAVIENDARVFPGFKFTKGDCTGRSIFKRGDERLEVYTANKRPLEETLGVDLIYWNVTQKSIVMLQYKMLEPSQKDEEDMDWVYRPDKQLEKELSRMKKFSVAQSAGPLEYRLNSEVFYLKFVKRNALIGKGSLVLPLEHFEKVRLDPKCKGPKGGFRVSYQSLAGRYMRSDTFLNLVHAGYIGAFEKTTKHFKVLVDTVLKNDRAIVAAIQRQVAPD